MTTKGEFNEEALEQAATEYSNIWETQIEKNVSFVSFINGGKLVAEKMYSEQEVIELNLKYLQGLGKAQGHWLNFPEWFEQNKKK